MENNTFEYSDGVDQMIGHLLFDPAQSGPRPGVLVTPAFGGVGAVEMDTAEALAKLGYVALAVDYYGGGKRANDAAEAMALMAGVTRDRSVLIRRMQAALSALKGLEMVDETRTAAMGYCLGGKAVLDLARSGADVQAAVSLHGVYDAPEGVTGPIAPSVLVLHGWEDPLATPDDVLMLSRELTEKCEDWQLLAFGQTGHSFTNPSAQHKEGGMMYSPRASARSWSAVTAFLAERFAG